MTFFFPCSVNLAQNHQKVKTNLVTHDIKKYKKYLYAQISNKKYS